MSAAARTAATAGESRFLRASDFAVNIGKTLALKFAKGLPEPAKQPGYPDQVSFALVDGRRLYLPELAADLISREGIAAGEKFILGRYEVRRGQTKAVHWRVDRMDARDAQAPEPETPLAANLRRSAVLARAGAGKAGHPGWDELQAAELAPPPVRPARPAAYEPPAAAREAVPTNGPTQQANGASRAPSPSQPVNGAGETTAEIMLCCYREAIFIAKQTVADAEAAGLRVTPVFEDLRTMAATLLITKTGRR